MIIGNNDVLTGNYVRSQSNECKLQAVGRWSGFSDIHLLDTASNITDLFDAVQKFLIIHAQMSTHQSSDFVRRYLE